MLCLPCQAGAGTARQPGQKGSAWLFLVLTLQNKQQLQAIF